MSGRSVFHVATPDRPRASARDFSLALHAFTASGALVGMAALVAVLDGSARLAIIWLLVAQLIDGIDGPLARRLLPDEATTRFDGYVLDFELVPHDRYGMLVVAVMLLTSSLWFSRTDQMSDDGWFRGFPSAWNMVIPTLWLLSGSQLSSSIVIILLSVLTLTDIEFAHPVRARSWRVWNLISMTVWIWSVVAGVVTSPEVPMAAQMAMLVGPVMIAVTVVSRVLGSASDEPMGDTFDDTYAPR